MFTLPALFFIYICLGTFVGLISGLFGIGGGIVIVPILLFSFELMKFHPDILMHLAIGTSLSIILVTVISSARSHSKIIPIDKKIVLKMIIPIALGTFIGGQIGGQISSQTLKYLFGTYAALVALKMFLHKNVEGEPKHTPLYLYIIVGMIIGFKSAILGIGGGTISIPFLLWRGHPLRKAVGISATIGIPIALVGSSSYILLGQSAMNLPEHSFGYVYMPAFFGVIMTSPFFAKIGAKYSHTLPQRKLKVVFACLLVIISLKAFLK